MMKGGNRNFHDRQEQDEIKNGGDLYEIFIG